MPKFVIERDIPGAGKLSPAELKKISQKSCGVLSSLGPSVNWIHSYVTADRIYCIYYASDESLIMRHAELGGRPYVAHAFEKMIRYCKQFEDIVWFPTRAELAQYMLENSKYVEPYKPVT